MEGCSKASAGAVPVLPDDPLVEILSRLPAKSVCRFKCVSKAWRDLIAHPDHRKKLRQPMQGLFVETSEFSNNRLARTDFSFVDLSVRTVPLDIDPGFSFLKERIGIENFFFLDSCNGLILFVHRHQPFNELAGYIVCNPTTKQWLAIPPGGSPKGTETLTYLAFDPAVSSHFHLFQFQMPDEDEPIDSLHVYSSETGTWSQNQIDKQKEQGHLEGWHHQFTLDHIHPQWAFVNGFLHLIVWNSDEEEEHILALDVQGKARRLITVPGMADRRHEHTGISYFGQSQGHLHCVIGFSILNNHKNSIWVLQDYDTQEWVLKYNVDCLDFFEGTSCTDISDVEVFDIHQDYNVIYIFLQYLGYKLVAYDMDRKEMSVIVTFDDHKYNSDFARYVPYFSESPALTDKH